MEARHAPSDPVDLVGRVGPSGSECPGRPLSGDYSAAALVAISEGVVVHLATGEIVGCNPAAERILGLSCGQMAGRTSLDPGWRAIHLDGTPFPGEEHPAMVTLRTGESLRGVVMGIHTPDGTLRWISINTEPIPGADGRPASVVAIFVDITERHRAEESLQELQVLLKALVDSTNDLIWSVDPETFGLLTFNRALEEYFLEARDLKIRIGHRPEDLLPPAVADRWHEMYRTTLREGFFSAEYVTHAGMRTLDLSAHVLERKGRVFGISVFGRDVTERRRSEGRVLARTAELTEANRELEAFSYSVSHELRTPLRAIDGHSAMILRDCAELLDDEGRRHLGQIRGNAQRMGRLIDDLLGFSRAGRVDLAVEKLDMTEAAKEAFTRVVPDSASARRISFSIAVLPEVTGDPELLCRVWENLLSNAVKFSAGKEKPEIRVEGSIEGDEAVYRVRDNGVGFDMKYVDKVFGVFHRLHAIDEFEGTGVGLALVRRIVMRHGGRTWAEGELDRGAVLSFSLPARNG
ncbi:MAG: PAS domain S-box protein [Holophagales bacterium]|nr:PAS domain S-box protein [Holophagales bacterium]